MNHFVNLHQLYLNMSLLLKYLFRGYQNDVIGKVKSHTNLILHIEKQKALRTWELKAHFKHSDKLIRSSVCPPIHSSYLSIDSVVAVQVKIETFTFVAAFDMERWLGSVYVRRRHSNFSPQTVLLVEPLWRMIPWHPHWSNLLKTGATVTKSLLSGTQSMPVFKMLPLELCK